MKTIELAGAAYDLPELLRLAGEGNLILRTEDGKEFVLAELARVPLFPFDRIPVPNCLFGCRSELIYIVNVSGGNFIELQIGWDPPWETVCFVFFDPSSYGTRV